MVYRFLFFPMYVASCRARNGPRQRHLPPLSSPPPPPPPDDVHGNFLQTAYTCSSKEKDMGWKGKEIIYGSASSRRILFSTFSNPYSPPCYCIHLHCIYTHNGYIYYTKCQNVMDCFCLLAHLCSEERLSLYGVQSLLSHRQLNSPVL